MERKISDKTEMYDLQVTVSNLLKSYNRRNVAFLIIAHSDILLSTTVTVTGKRGVAQKNFILFYNDESEKFEIHSEGIVYILESISEISNVVKRMITNLSNLVVKMN